LEKDEEGEVLERCSSRKSIPTDSSSLIDRVQAWNLVNKCGGWLILTHVADDGTLATRTWASESVYWDCPDLIGDIERLMWPRLYDLGGEDTKEIEKKAESRKRLNDLLLQRDILAAKNTIALGEEDARIRNLLRVGTLLDKEDRLEDGQSESSEQASRKTAPHNTAGGKQKSALRTDDEAATEDAEGDEDDDNLPPRKKRKATTSDSSSTKRQTTDARQSIRKA
jgi:hypothetical protein